MSLNMLIHPEHSLLPLTLTIRAGGERKIEPPEEAIACEQHRRNQNANFVVSYADSEHRSFLLEQCSKWETNTAPYRAVTFSCPCSE